MSKVSFRPRPYYENFKTRWSRRLSSNANFVYVFLKRANWFLLEVGPFGRLVINILTLLFVLQSFKWWFLNHQAVLNGGNNLVNLTIILFMFDILITIWTRFKTREPQGFGAM